MSAKEILGNKKILSILQDKYNEFINSFGHDLKRGDSAIDSKRTHVKMNNYKTQTKYHEKEIMALKNDLDHLHETVEGLTSINLDDDVKSLELP